MRVEESYQKNLRFHQEHPDYPVLGGM